MKSVIISIDFGHHNLHSKFKAQSLLQVLLKTKRHCSPLKLHINIAAKVVAAVQSGVQMADVTEALKLGSNVCVELIVRLLQVAVIEFKLNICRQNQH